jgi:CHAT domain-containing protein
LYSELAGLSQLAGARKEGQLVGRLLGVSPWLGRSATEARLRQVQAPSILHIATHGLFLGPLNGSGRGLRSKAVGLVDHDTYLPVLGQTQDRSLSRSALVLAHPGVARQAADSTNDGLLTAEEARSLYLFGTQLVVLSACDTGRGTVKAGQGVYGLRRAFLSAGAQTVVMSLWPVSDAGTQGLMERYYRLLLDPTQPRGRVSGLAEAMRSLKAEKPHPYFWAAFIANGIDAPLGKP